MSQNQKSQVRSGSSSAVVQSIVLLIPYFGTLPNHFDLFLRGVRFNSSIEWRIISEIEPPKDLPPNLSFVQCSLVDFTELIQQTCGTRPTIQHPADLCNLRPAFGHIFRDLVKGFDFWGHADLDMILGDLRAFLPESVLETHDRIYCRGHLSLYKNTDAVNHAFRLQTPDVPSFEEILQNPRNRQYDEWRGIHRILRYHGYRQYHDEVIADIRPPGRYYDSRFETTELQNHEFQMFYWFEGKTFQAYLHGEGGVFDKEVAYVHFQKRQLAPPSGEVMVSRGFTIGRKGFEKYSLEPLTPNDFTALNSGSLKPINVICKETVERIKAKVRKAFCVQHL